MSIPQSFICPITHDIMGEPVIAPDGYTYDKDAIITWLSNHNTSPITKQYMTVSQLVPNRALKDSIDEYKKQSLVPTDFIQTVEQTSAVPISSRDPVRIVALIDISGSMNSICDLKSAEAVGFTRLDLVKQVIKTIIYSLSPNDEIGLVTFNNKANVILKLTNVTKKNIQSVISQVESLRANGGTNIWDSLRVACNLVSEYSQNNTTNLLLFTDGESNVDPPNGIVNTLNTFLESKPQLNLAINTYGFSKDINSGLLYEISTIKNGVFGFIPDASMIGTVFVNSLAYIMTKNKFVVGDDDRDFITQIRTTLSNVFTDRERCQNIIDTFCSTITSSNAFHQSVKSDFTKTSDPSSGQVAKAVEQAYFNAWGKHYLRSVLSAYNNCFCLNFKDKGVQYFKTPEFETHQKHIENIFINMDPPTPTGLTVPSVALHSSPVLTASAAVHSSPVLTASAALRSSPSPMTSRTFSNTYYNTSGGCIASGSTVSVQTNDGIRSCCVDDIQPGMSVLTRQGVDVVKQVIKLKFTGMLSCYGSQRLTCYHPVFMTNRWQFPQNIQMFNTNHYSNIYVYDFILEKHDSVDMGDFYAITLRHNIKNDRVASHDYFGTNAIVRDFMRHPDWNTGYITVDEYRWIRDISTNRICGIIF